MQIMKLIACIFVVLTVSACITPEPDIQVSMEDSPLLGIAAFKVDALENDVVISRFSIDGGKCPSKEFDPVTLPYGKSKIFGGMCSSDIIKEVEITTNRGTFQFEFK